MAASFDLSAARPDRADRDPVLTAEDREHLTNLLEAERAALVERTSALVDETDRLEPTATSGRGETEHTALEIERGMNATLEAHARDAVREVDTALARVAAGTIGMCEGCGRAIPRERLFAVPTARMCVRCQEASGGGRRLRRAQ